MRRRRRDELKSDTHTHTQKAHTPHYTTTATCQLTNNLIYEKTKRTIITNVKFFSSSLSLSLLLFGFYFIHFSRCFVFYTGWRSLEPQSFICVIYTHNRALRSTYCAKLQSVIELFVDVYKHFVCFFSSLQLFF